MSNDNDVVILSGARTATGNLGGSLAALQAPALGSAAINGAILRANISKNEIEEVIMGCVLSAGQGQAPARQAALQAELPFSTPATTVNKMCGSGMKALMLAHDEIKAGSFNLIVAGGMESMSNAPYLVPNARFGYRLGHAKFIDHMMLDGLEDAYDKGKSMGVFAEMCVDKYKFTREQMDEFAIRSLKRAKLANEDGSFKDEIEPVVINTRRGEQLVELDENPFNAKLEKIPQLKPAFKKEGSVTAANSSSISDGAAALVLSSAAKANSLNATPVARVVAHYSHAQEPAWFTTAPTKAIEGVLAKARWSVNEVDLFEINEAFAAVAMSAIHDLDLNIDKVNIHGGACAIGHPIGASGARILVTLIHALKQHHLKKGIAALCIGGGEATAVAIELI